MSATARWVLVAVLVAMLAVIGWLVTADDDPCADLAAPTTLVCAGPSVNAT